jgi:hypothetical protein
MHMNAYVLYVCPCIRDAYLFPFFSIQHLHCNVRIELRSTCLTMKREHNIHMYAVPQHSVEHAWTVFWAPMPVSMTKTSLYAAGTPGTWPIMTSV